MIRSSVACWILTFLTAGMVLGQDGTGYKPEPDQKPKWDPHRPRLEAIPPGIAAEPYFEDGYFGGDCDSCSAGGCTSCCLPRYFGGIEYLLWTRKGMDLPVLVTDDAQVPNVLFGDDAVGDTMRPGGRINLGVWIDNSQCFGVGASYFMLGESRISFDSSVAGDTTVVRPFIQNGQEQVLVVNLPGQIDGSVTSQTGSDIQGGDVYLRRILRCGCGTRVDFLAGYQTSRIDEELFIRHRFTDLNTDANFDGFDRFATKNEFHGGELGLLAEAQQSCWTFSGLAKIGLGNMRETVLVSGSNITGTGADASLLARQSNAGTRTRDEFVVVPEVSVKAAYHINSCLDVTAGYSYIYWSRVAQPGDQIDLVLPNPRPLLNSGSYFVHGVNFGVNLRF